MLASHAKIFILFLYIGVVKIGMVQQQAFEKSGKTRDPTRRRRKNRPLQSFQNIDLFFWTDHKLVQNVRLSLCWKKTINGSQRFDWFMTVPPFYTTVSHITFFSCPKNNIVVFFRYFLFFSHSQNFWLRSQLWLSDTLGDTGKNSQPELQWSLAINKM